MKMMMDTATVNINILLKRWVQFIVFLVEKS